MANIAKVIGVTVLQKNTPLWLPLQSVKLTLYVYVEFPDISINFFILITAAWKIEWNGFIWLAVHQQKYIHMEIHNRVTSVQNYFSSWKNPVVFFYLKMFGPCAGTVNPEGAHFWRMDLQMWAPPDSSSYKWSAESNSERGGERWRTVANEILLTTHQGGTF